MELLLNLFWLLVALAGIGLWWTRWSPANRSRRRWPESLRSAVGLCCVLVLLFFAISLTDDLQQVPAIAEDSRTPRGPLQVWKVSPCSTESGKQEASFEGVIAAKFLCRAVAVLGHVINGDAPVPGTASRQLLPSRAPPLPALLSL